MSGPALLGLANTSSWQNFKIKLILLLSSSFFITSTDNFTNVRGFDVIPILKTAQVYTLGRASMWLEITICRFPNLCLSRTFMTCTARNMFRSHDKRAQGLFCSFSFHYDCYTRFPFVLAAQGTKNLYRSVYIKLSFRCHSVIMLLYSVDLYI